MPAFSKEDIAILTDFLLLSMLEKHPEKLSEMGRKRAEEVKVLFLAAAASHAKERRLQ